MASLELCVGRSVYGTLSGVEMICHPLALQTQLSSQHEMPHSAATQHSGPMYPVMYITLKMRYLLMVSDALATNNTVTIPGTLRTRQTLNTGKLLIYQVVRTSLTEDLI